MTISGLRLPANCMIQSKYSFKNSARRNPEKRNKPIVAVVFSRAKVSKESPARCKRPLIALLEALQELRVDELSDERHQAFRGGDAQKPEEEKRHGDMLVRSDAQESSSEESRTTKIVQKDTIRGVHTNGCVTRAAHHVYARTTRVVHVATCIVF